MTVVYPISIMTRVCRPGRVHRHTALSYYHLKGHNSASYSRFLGNCKIQGLTYASNEYVRHPISAVQNQPEISRTPAFTELGQVIGSGDLRLSC